MATSGIEMSVAKHAYPNFPITSPNRRIDPAGVPQVDKPSENDTDMGPKNGWAISLKNATDFPRDLRWVS